MSNYLHKFLVLIFLVSMVGVKAQQLAFPGAEGFGRFTTGGRGGVIYEVTNLTDAGIGSLRYGIESITGARTIVFRVSGNIELTKSLQIKKGDLTIAGQTAPGDGICIRNKKLIVPAGAVTTATTLSSYSVSVDADNVIIRYLRFRPGDEIDNTVGAPIANIKFENDGLTGRDHKNVIIDHCSMSWAIDEVSSFYDNTNFTMQWCLIGESLYHSFHPKGDHGYGGIWGGMGATFHHNLLADHTSRNPRFCGSRYHCVFPQTDCGITLPASTEIVDYRNNVIYNWAGNSAYGGEGGQQNMVNNYYKQGPGTTLKGGSVRYRIVSPSISTDPKVDSLSKWFIGGNYVVGYTDVTSNNAHGSGFQPDKSDSTIGLWARVNAPFTFGAVATQTAQDSYTSVLDNCGASLHRDTVDKRIIYQARTGTATTGDSFGANTGIIDSPGQVGGWPVLNSISAPVDSDHDGMSDDWETAHGLNPNDATDRNSDVNQDGYTSLEEYLNSILVNSQTALVSSISILGDSTIVKGETVTFTASILPANASNKTLKWTLRAQDAALASINLNTGVFTATAVGKVVITAMANDASGVFIPKNVRIKSNTETGFLLGKGDSELFRIFPNPIHETMNFEFNLPKNSMVSVSLLDLSGKILLRLFNHNVSCGSQCIPLALTLPTGRMVSSGMYLCRVTIEGVIFIRKVIIL